MEHEMVTDMPSWQNGRDPVERGADQRGGGCIIFGTHRPGVSASRRGTHLSDGCNSRGPPRDSVVATGATPAAATASTLGAAGTEAPATQLDAAAPDPGSQNSPRVLRGGGCAVVVSEASCLMRNPAMDESSGGSSGVTGAVPGAATGATPAAATASTLGAQTLASLRVQDLWETH